MLVNLHIVNLALIDELDIDFTEGLNILTGETGAGKSIIIGSIGIGLGGKYDTQLLRDPEKDGLVELLFSVDRAVAVDLAEEEIEVEDGEILISRRLTGGRSINRINDKTVTVAKLRRVAERLISLHAQHEQRTLLKTSKHLEMVDQYDEAIATLKTQVSESYREYMSVKGRLDSLTMDETDRTKRIDYIAYEINDIESARLRAGEDRELEDIYRRASNAQSIAEITARVEGLTGYSQQMSAGSQISEALGDMRQLTRYDESAEELLSTLTDIDSLVSDFSRQLSEYISDMEYDEDTLRVTEERLNLINTLKARYGSSIEDIEQMLDTLRAERDELDSYEDTKKRLEEEESRIYAELMRRCETLSAKRREVATRLCSDIAGAMKELNFSEVQFDMDFQRAEEPGANGIDIAQFIISTNVGEPMKPLTDVASGGELSRVMLAIKSVISEMSDTPTLIFDEIDVGISGITADRVGTMMHRLSDDRQIISITHLPQIAACADTAFVIEKSVIKDKTITSISRLDEEGRVRELARLLGGSSISDSVLSTARELIDKNKKY